jgi:hypothetical protein
MSADRKDYIVVGVDIHERPDEHYKGDIEELCDKYYFQYETGKMTFINDFYNGEYFIIGEVLHSSDGYDEGLDYNLFGKEMLIENAKLRVKAFLLENFDIHSEPYVIVKTQWS